MRHFRIATVAVFTLLSAAPAMAHPGHGESGANHYFIEPEHVGMLIAAAALSLTGAAIVYGRVRKSNHAT